MRLEYRSLVAGVVAIGWQTYLSLLDSRVRRAEREKKHLPQEQSVGDGGVKGVHAQGSVQKEGFGFSGTGVEGRGEKCTA